MKVWRSVRSALPVMLMTQRQTVLIPGPAASGTELTYRFQQSTCLGKLGLQGVKINRFDCTQML